LDSKKIAAVLLGGAAVAGAAYLLYRVIKEEYSFVEEQGLDLKLLPEPVLEEVVEGATSYRSKMDRALFLIQNENEKFSMDVAAFLAFASLEEFLRNILNKFGVKLKSRLAGIVDACKRLRSLGGKAIIAREDYDRIKELTKNLRNPVFHGEVYKKEEVPDAVNFINEFITRYELAPVYLAI
jgi:hypothetical protein